jgi:hypothetical protein
MRLRVRVQDQPIGGMTGAANVNTVGHQNPIDEENQAVAFVRTDTREVDPSVRSDWMLALAFAALAYVRAFLVSRHRLALEVVALSPATGGLEAQATAP